MIRMLWASGPFGHNEFSPIDWYYWMDFIRFQASSHTIQASSWARVLDLYGPYSMVKF